MQLSSEAFERELTEFVLQTDKETADKWSLYKVSSLDPSVIASTYYQYKPRSFSQGVNQQ